MTVPGTSTRLWHSEKGTRASKKNLSKMRHLPFHTVLASLNNRRYMTQNQRVQPRTQNNILHLLVSAILFLHRAPQALVGSEVRSVALSAAVLGRPPSAVVVASLEGNPMGGAEKRDANYFGKKAITIARAPSVIDHGVGPQRLCVCPPVGIWVGVGLWARGAQKSCCPHKFGLGVCWSYKKTANKEWWLLWQKVLMEPRD